MTDVTEGSKREEAAKEAGDTSVPFRRVAVARIGAHIHNVMAEYPPRFLLDFPHGQPRTDRAAWTQRIS